MEKDIRRRIDWIDVIRGFGIIAVVVCHQQYLLHTSELIQCITLYSVSTLVFLMGITKVLSIEKYWKVNPKARIFDYTLKSLKSVMLPYGFAVWVTVRHGGGICYEFDTIISQILTFNACPPFYYMYYVVILSIWAPFLFGLANWICKRKNRLLSYVLSVFAIIFAYIIGYISIGRLDIVGQSYFVIYLLGIFVGIVINRLPRVNVFYLLLSVTLLVFGFLSTKKFYFARVDGNFCYDEGIDSLCPLLQMNPPNLSIIIYFLGVVCTLYSIYHIIPDSISARVFLPFKILGKYSQDIFLWHLFIQNFFNYNFTIANIVEKNIVYYLGMFMLPISVRWIYEKIKKEVYCQLEKM